MLVLYSLFLASWTLVGQQTAVKPTYQLYRTDLTVVGNETITINTIPGIQYGWWSTYARGRESDSVDLVFQYACAPVDSFWAINQWDTVRVLTDTLFHPDQLYPVTLMLMQFRIVGGVSNKQASTGTKFTAYLCRWEL